MAGYSGTPLPTKLGIKAGFSLVLMGAPPRYRDLLVNLPPEVRISKVPSGSHDLIQFFTTSETRLKQTLPRLKKAIKPSGMIWISWPKKSAKVPSDVTENIVRKLAIAIGLIDVKVCAIDETWSGLKLVIPIKDRNKNKGGKS